METQNLSDVVMARAKIIHILIIKVNIQVVFLFLVVVYSKRNRNIYSVFLSSYRNTRGSLGELKKAVETLTCGLCSHSISRSPILALVFL